MKSITCCVALVAAVLCAAPAARAGGKTVSFSLSNSFSPVIKGATKQAFGGYDQKIIGGLMSSIKNYPYMADITIKTGKTVSQQCGGTVLDMYHVLTAAHCFTNRNPKIYEVRAGSDYWRYQGQLVGVSKIMIHPKFNNETLDYDVAVVRINRAFKLGSTIKPVTLVPVNTAVKADTPIYLVGWGYTDALHSNPPSTKLRAVSITTISSSECSDDYSEYSLTVTSRMFCGMGINKDSCQGDSGGPVIIKSTGKQQGIISWGMGCAQIGSPGVYANLANREIRSFITTSLKK